MLPHVFQCLFTSAFISPLQWLEEIWQLSHQGNWRRNSNSRDVVTSSPSFSRPTARVPWRACSQATKHIIQINKLLHCTFNKTLLKEGQFGNKSFIRRLRRTDLPLKSKRWNLKEGEIELLKELHISSKPVSSLEGEGQDLTKCKVNHYHKPFKKITSTVLTVWSSYSRY